MYETRLRSQRADKKCRESLSPTGGIIRGVLFGRASEHSRVREYQMFATSTAVNIFAEHTLFICFFIETLQNAILFLVMLACIWTVCCSSRGCASQNIARNHSYMFTAKINTFCENFWENITKLHIFRSGYLIILFNTENYQKKY